MFALVFGVLFAVSFLGFAITSRSKYSAASHLIWCVAFIIFTVCYYLRIFATQLKHLIYRCGLSFYY